MNNLVCVLVLVCKGQTSGEFNIDDVGCNVNDGPLVTDEDGNCPNRSGSVASCNCCFIMAPLSRCNSISSLSSLSFLSLATCCWYSAACLNAASSCAHRAASSLVCWSLSSASLSFRSASWILARADDTLECCDERLDATDDELGNVCKYSSQLLITRW